MTYKILHYEKVTSTNDLLKELAREGAREGLVVWADYQSKGRGRFKRKWRSPKGKDLLFSILLKPNVQNSEASLVTILAGQAVREVLKDRFDLPATLKRPNDVLVNGKKICGILTEAEGSPSKLDFIVVGIGLNVNSKKKQLLARATSIRELTGKETPREALLEEVLSEFKKQYKILSRK